MTAEQRNFLNTAGNKASAANQALATAAGVRGALTIAVIILIIATILAFFVKKSPNTRTTEDTANLELSE